MEDSATNNETPPATVPQKETANEPFSEEPYAVMKSETAETSEALKDAVEASADTDAAAGQVEPETASAEEPSNAGVGIEATAPAPTDELAKEVEDPAMKSEGSCESGEVTQELEVVGSGEATVQKDRSSAPPDAEKAKPEESPGETATVTKSLGELTAVDDSSTLAPNTEKQKSRTDAALIDPVAEDIEPGKSAEAGDEGDVAETATDATADTQGEEATGSTPVVVMRGGRSRPTFKYHPDKVTLRFLFANMDGLTVQLECNPSDTVGEVKGALLSAWPEEAPACNTADNLRLICMGKGYLQPDSQTLAQYQIPTFETHATPINVAIRPQVVKDGDVKDKKSSTGHGGSGNVNAPNSPNIPQTSAACPCSIL